MPKRGTPLSEALPKVAKLWHPTKNGNLTPEKISFKNKRKVWWICPNNAKHDYLNSVQNQANGFSCPYCAGQKVNETNSLSTLYPELLKKWNYDKNINLSPKDFTPGSSKKVWWKCPVADDHQWQASIYSVALRNGKCPMCLGRIIVKSNCMASTHPDLSEEWAQDLNEHTPSEVVTGTNKKYWWTCKRDSRHSWKASPNSRYYNGTGCPYCVGQKVDITNSLKTTNPELLDWWDYEKNSVLPNEITAGAKSRRWWKCQKADDHTWQASPFSLKRGQRCPYCAGQKIAPSNSLAIVFPDIASQLHPTLNGKFDPLKTYMHSRRRAFWKCSKGDDHIWEAVVRERTGKDETGCPVCQNRIIVKSNCLQTTHPDLAKEWAFDLNGKVTPDNTGAGSNKRVWWRCKKVQDHVWRTDLNNRSGAGHGCPYCVGRLVDFTNCLKTLNPSLAEEWHPTFNENLTPEKVTTGSGRRVWWKCDKAEDHVWKASISDRNPPRESGCPMCASKIIVKSNCMQTTHPELSKEFALDLNKILTPSNIGAGSSIMVWWRCSNDSSHIWKAIPISRSRGRDCPYCSLTPQSKQELAISFELKSIFKDINPRGFKTRIENKMYSIDIYIPGLNLGIEFDGSHWHKKKADFDKMKSNTIRESGFNLIRVREEPLKKLHEEDIISKNPFNAKIVVDEILSHIQSVFHLSTAQKRKIEKYKSQDTLKNTRSLNRYIEEVLIWKAKKKKYSN